MSQGEWQVVYRWYDDEPWGWRDWHLAVTIGDSGPPGLARITSSETSGCLYPSGTPGGSHIPVSRAELRQNVPNPFNPQTTIAFDLPTPASVSLRVFDVSGRLVRVLLDGDVFPDGRHEAIWNGRDETGHRMASGTYFYRLEAGPYSETKRMVLMK